MKLNNCKIPRAEQMVAKNFEMNLEPLSFKRLSGRPTKCLKKASSKMDDICLGRGTVMEILVRPVMMRTN